MLASYIGITDFTNFSQVQKMREVFRAHRKSDSRRLLHVGVMMSYKTLHGIETKWSAAFPPKETIASIFQDQRDSDDLYYCLHYADYDHKERFWKDLCTAIKFCGKHVDAIQLDMVWPDPDEIAAFLKVIDLNFARKIDVILQIGKNAIEEADNDPAKVVQKLKGYEGAIQRVLLDKSMGRGLGMDAVGLLPFARAIRNEFPSLGIGAAGGLGPDTMHLVEPLVREFPDLSIDAQGRLRPSGNALDPINWDMASEYLVKALELFGESRSSTV